MTFYGSEKLAYEQSGGIRRIETRYSGDIDKSGKFRLKRCVGKSFLDKSQKAGGSYGTSREQAADKACRDFGARTGKSA